MYRWTWPAEGPKKLKKSLKFHLNAEMQVKVVGKSEVYLKFESSKEQIKLPVGQLPDEQMPENPEFDPAVSYMLEMFVITLSS